MPDEEREGSGKGWLVPGLLMIAIAAGIMVFAKRGNDEKPKSAHDSAAVAPTNANAGATPLPGPQVGAVDTAPTEKGNVASADTPVTNDEAARLAAEQAAQQKADEEKSASLAAEQAAKQKVDEEKAKLAAEQTAKQKADEEKAAKLAAEQAAKQKAADEKAARLAAEKAAKQKAADEKAARLAAEQAAKQKAADEKAARLAAEQAARQKAAEEHAAKLATDKSTKVADKSTKVADKSTKVADKSTKAAVDKSTPASVKPTSDDEISIEDTYAAGDYAKTNAACTANAVFTAKKLELCALAACRTSNAPLAKRWVNAIAKASRDDIIAQCKALGLDLAPAPPPASTPAPPATPDAPAAPETSPSP
ncbi:MAG: hypothetical protein HOV81_23055 [Kofleriaceae bacterium]|nr:hypothetical protein [Kofleriaceae bacterium]